MKNSPVAFFSRLVSCLALAALVALPACAQAPASIREKAIFGNDDRQDLYEVKDQRLLDYADSTVALIPGVDLTPDASGASYRLRPQIYGEVLSLCKEERFWDQPLAAHCSGFLVAPDLMLTSAACIFEAADCQTYQFVFGFSVREKGRYPASFPVKDIYSCSAIVAQDQGYGHWTLVRLDRKVRDHRPLALNRSGNIADGVPLIGIGPDLVPTKVTGGGKVFGPPSDTTFRASLDSGNAGMPVFRRDTGLVEGIMTWFPPQFQYDDGQQCYRITRCSDAENVGGVCAGVNVTKISAIAPFLPSPGLSEKKTDVAPPDPKAFASFMNVLAAEAASLSRQ